MAVCMVAMEEAGDAMARMLFIPIVMPRAARPHDGIAGGEGYCSRKDSKKENSHPEFFSAITMGSSFAWQLSGRAKFVRPGSYCSCAPSCSH